MLISLRADGTAVMLLPSHVYQGSNVANVFVTAPFPNTTVLQVGFTLPNGTSVPATASAPMTYVQDPENNLVVWKYTIAAAITNEAGAASVSITAKTQTGQVIVSQSVPFTIEETTLPVLPDTPSQDEYTLILQYIQQNSANISTIQGQISTIESDVETANSNASAAVSTANAAQQTANEAKTTADGLAASIAQANTTASEALSTANEAASAAASNTAAIEDIVSGTTTVAKSDSANSATSAESAINDGDGNNIKDTYATKTELSTGNADTLAAAQDYTNQALSNYSIIEIVQTLPETGDTGKIYLVPKADSTSSDLYSEYLWNGSAWELIGTVTATSGTTIKVNGVSQIEVDFDSDPQTQITANATAIANIENGTTTVPNATNATNATNASQLGGVAASSYAQLSQVVRTDVAQTLTDGQKKQFCQNIGLDYISSVAGKLSTAGWHTICKMNGSKLNGKAGVIYIKKAYSQSSPSSFILTYNQTGYAKPVLTVQALTNTSGYKFRLFLDSIADEVYVQIYIPENYVNVWYLSGMAARNLELELVVDNTVDNRDTSSLQGASEVEAISNGINTTGGVFQNGASVLAIDPTTLTPSTDNGWSIGDSSTQLADGVYKIYPITSGYLSIVMDLTMANGSGVASVSIGYSGNNNTAFIVVESLRFENQVLSEAKWVNTEVNTSVTFATSYYYKKLT